MKQSEKKNTIILNLTVLKHVKNDHYGYNSNSFLTNSYIVKKIQ